MYSGEKKEKGPLEKKVTWTSAFLLASIFKNVFIALTSLWNFNVNENDKNPKILVLLSLLLHEQI